MKRLILIALIFLFIPGVFLWADNFLGKKEGLSIEPPRKALLTPEVLRYSVEWLGVPVGKIILTTEGTEQINSRPCYLITARTFPNRFFVKLFDVEYKLASYTDKEGLYSLRFIKARRIKEVSDEMRIDFDQKNHRAFYKFFVPGGPAEIITFPSMRKERVVNAEATIDIPEQCQDLLSSLYYFRLLDIKEKNTYPVNISYGQVNWEMNVSAGKPYKKDFYKKGSLGVFTVSPKTQLADFILGKRELSITFTSDSARVPVIITVNTAIGQFRACLENLPDK